MIKLLRSTGFHLRSHDIQPLIMTSSPPDEQGTYPAVFHGAVLHFECARLDNADVYLTAKEVFTESECLLLQDKYPPLFHGPVLHFECAQPDHPDFYLTSKEAFAKPECPECRVRYLLATDTSRD